MVTKKKSAARQTAVVVREASLAPAVAMTGITASVTTAMPDHIKARIKRVITVPSLVMKTPGLGRALRFDSEIRLSKVEGKVNKETGKKEDPAQIANVTDVETGEQFVFLVPSVVRKNIEQDYADEAYIGKIFWIQNMGKRTATQRYWDFGIAEMEPEAS